MLSTRLLFSFPTPEGMRVGHISTTVNAPIPPYQQKRSSKLTIKTFVASHSKEPAGGVAQEKADAFRFNILSSFGLGLQNVIKEKEEIRELVARTAEQAVKVRSAVRQAASHG